MTQSWLPGLPHRALASSSNSRYSRGACTSSRSWAEPGFSSLSTSLCTDRRWHFKLRAQADEGDDKPVQYSNDFGYNRKDVLLIGTGLLALGFGLYYGLQATGMEPGMAGNFVQAGIFLSLCIGWVASYLLRVINKDMTYSKQLEQYEDAVMQKRLEEMPETERARLYEEVEAERTRRKR